MLNKQDDGEEKRKYVQNFSTHNITIRASRKRQSKYNLSTIAWVPYYTLTAMWIEPFQRTYGKSRRKRISALKGKNSFNILFRQVKKKTQLAKRRTINFRSTLSRNAFFPSRLPKVLWNTKPPSTTATNHNVALNMFHNNFCTPNAFAIYSNMTHFLSLKRMIRFSLTNVTGH